MFVRNLLSDKVKLRPADVGKNLPTILQKLVANKFEGKCSQFGYIRPDSVVIHKYSIGHVIATSLNGDIGFTVLFFADVCNPIVGSIIKAKVVNTNKFGILAEYSIKIKDKSVLTPILEIIIAKNTNTLASEVDPNTVNVGDVLNIEIIGKKFELNDKKISAIGRIVKEGRPLRILKTAQSLQQPKDDEEEDVEIDSEDDDENEDSEEEDEEEDEEMDENEKEEKDDKDGEQDTDDDDTDDDSEEDFGDLEDDGSEEVGSEDYDSDDEP